MARLLIALTLLLGSLTAALSAQAQPPASSPMTVQAQDNRPYLLVFPVIVLGIIGVLVVVTRRK